MGGVTLRSDDEECGTYEWVDGSVCGQQDDLSSVRAPGCVAEFLRRTRRRGRSRHRALQLGRAGALVHLFLVYLLKFSHVLRIALLCDCFDAPYRPFVARSLTGSDG